MSPAATGVDEPQQLTKDDGTTTATIVAIGDTQHTLIYRAACNGEDPARLPAIAHIAVPARHPSTPDVDDASRDS